jgi:hypothetical protein
MEKLAQGGEGINKSCYRSNLSQTSDKVVDPLGALQGPRIGASTDKKPVARQMCERSCGVAMFGINPVDNCGELQRKE